ncbi:MAG: TIGR01212 family radical SAM protein [Candidatus Omnitrophica bacterium]|nr:TIGR01212 family radical SAM protein [Candidatus Omnitrophota bacterium]
MERYYKFSQYLRKQFGCRVQKVTVDAGFSCPNRDGKLSTEGCVYCDNRGFSFNTRLPARSIEEQITEGIAAGRERFKAEKFMVYFQAFTNTYATLDVLKKRYDAIRQFDNVVALAIGTRPDCVNEEILDLIDSYSQDYEVWLEYGLQSIHDTTLTQINRHHTFNDFFNTVKLTRRYNNINICVHIILGLPGETEDDMIKTAVALGDLKVEGVKIHPLHVVKGTKLEERYHEGLYVPLTLEKYVKIVKDVLECLSPQTVIQRITADCPSDMLIAPLWIREKANVLGKIDELLAHYDSFQGKQYHTSL